MTSIVDSGETKTDPAAITQAAIVWDKVSNINYSAGVKGLIAVRVSYVLTEIDDPDEINFQIIQ
jgi:hypothetical protein